jgi:hypothetical protein
MHCLLSLDGPLFVVSNRAFSKNRLRLRRIVYAAFIGLSHAVLAKLPCDDARCKSLESVV